MRVASCTLCEPFPSFSYFIAAGRAPSRTSAQNGQGSGLSRSPASVGALSAPPIQCALSCSFPVDVRIQCLAHPCRSLVHFVPSQKCVYVCLPVNPLSVGALQSFLSISTSAPGSSKWSGPAARPCWPAVAGLMGPGANPSCVVKAGLCSTGPITASLPTMDVFTNGNPSWTNAASLPASIAP